MRALRITRKKVLELRQIALNEQPTKQTRFGIALKALCDSWLRKDTEARRAREETSELVEFYEGVLKRRQELLKELLYDALRKCEDGLPIESSGVRAGPLSVPATRIYDSVLESIEAQL